MRDHADRTVAALDLAGAVDTQGGQLAVGADDRAIGIAGQTAEEAGAGADGRSDHTARVVDADVAARGGHTVDADRAGIAGVERVLQRDVTGAAVVGGKAGNLVAAVVEGDAAAGRGDQLRLHPHRGAGALGKVAIGSLQHQIVGGDVADGQRAGSLRQRGIGQGQVAAGLAEGISHDQARADVTGHGTVGHGQIGQAYIAAQGQVAGHQLRRHVGLGGIGQGDGSVEQDRLAVDEVRAADIERAVSAGGAIEHQGSDAVVRATHAVDADRAVVAGAVAYRQRTAALVELGSRSDLQIGDGIVNTVMSHGLVARDDHGIDLGRQVGRAVAYGGVADPVVAVLPATFGIAVLLISEGLGTAQGEVRQAVVTVDRLEHLLLSARRDDIPGH